MYFKIDENNKVTLQITGKFAESLECDNITTFKVDVVPSVERDEVLYFSPKTKAFYTKKVEITEEQKERVKARAAAIEQKDNALKWLADNDWKCNKIIRGEWTTDDPRWIEYLEGATKARQEQDEANAILNQNNMG